MAPPKVALPEAMFLFCLSVHSEILLTQYLEKYLTYLHQTDINDALRDKDERFTFWGQKVNGQGHMLETALYAPRHTVLDAPPSS